MWNMTRPQVAAPQNPARPPVSRAELKAGLARCEALQARARELQAETLAAEAAIDAAVAEHETETARIHAGLEATPDPTRRQKLLADLDRANTELDATCKSLRARIGVLQSEAPLCCWEGAQRGPFERQLIETASVHLQHQAWHLSREFHWLEERRRAAKKSLKAANNGDTELWRTELHNVESALAEVSADREKVRQEMIRE